MQSQSYSRVPIEYGLGNLKPVPAAAELSRICRDNFFSESASFWLKMGEKNAGLVMLGLEFPQPVKTGTTVAGVIYKDGVVLGADTRATDKAYVSDKNCHKIHFISRNMYCCGAGVAADTEMTTRMVGSQVELLRLQLDKDVPVVTGATLLQRTLYRYQGQIGASLVLGGCDSQGPHIYSIYPHGSMDKMPFASQGSGALAAMAVMEARFKNNLSENAAKKLVRDAIVAGIFNDLGSGSNVDLCVIRKGGPVDFLRPYEEANVKGKKNGKYRYRKGTTRVLKTNVIPLEVVQETVRMH